MAFSPLTEILSLVQKKYPALNKRIREAEALGRWESAVGPMIAKHSRAIRIQDSVLWVEVDHPIWKAELHHRKRQILDLLNGKKPEADSPPLVDILFLDPRPKTQPKVRLFFFIAFLLSFHSTSWAAKRNFCSKKYAQLFQSYTQRPLNSLQLKVGIEIEGSLPKDINYSRAASIIKRILKKNYSNVTTLYYDRTQQYQIYYKSPSNEIQSYKISRDPSIITDRTPFEISSAILKSDDDFKVFREIIEEIKNNGGKSEIASAGTHIHVNFENARTVEMANLAAIFSEIEKDLKKRFSVSPFRGRHIKNTSKDLLKLLNDETVQEDDSIRKLLKVQERNHALNLRSYSHFDTVEFRLFNSTLDLDAIELMVDFSTQLVKAIRTQNPKLVNYLTKNNDPIKLDQIAALLDMKINQPEAHAILTRIFNEGEKAIALQHTKSRQIQNTLSQLAVLLGGAAVINEVIKKTDLALSQEPNLSD